MPSPFSGNLVAVTKATGDANIDALLYGKQWATTQLTFSFVTPSSTFATGYDSSLTSSVQTFSVAQQASATALLKTLGNYVKLSLAPVDDSATVVGDIRIGFSTSSLTSSGAYGYFVGTTASAGDFWLNPARIDVASGGGTFGTNSFVPGTYGYKVLLWGLMNSMGLKNGSGTNSVSGLPLASDFDALEYTVMGSDHVAGVHDTIGETFYPTTPMLLDIAGLQAMYGANTSYNAGDTAYTFTDAVGQYYNQTIWDGGGNNTITYLGATNSTIDLRAGHGSVVGNKVFAYTATDSYTNVVPNLWIAYNTHINNAVAIGSANMTFIANDDGDALTGGSGNDSFTGGAGNDTLRGNAGNDSINGGAGVDAAVYAGKLADYQIKGSLGSANGITVLDARVVPGADGVDTLVGVERLRFADVGVALDMGTTQAGGKAVLTMAAALGPLFAAQKDWAATFLRFFDSGATILQGTSLLVDAGIMAAFAGGADNASFVKFVYHNLYAADPDPITLANLVAPLNAHTTTQAQWMADMALSTVNQLNVHLTGLAASGWQFQV